MLESGYDQFPCAHCVRSRQETLIHSVDKIQQSINGFFMEVVSKGIFMVPMTISARKTNRFKH
jgi:hypothetical protein